MGRRVCGASGWPAGAGYDTPVSRLRTLLYSRVSARGFEPALTQGYLAVEGFVVVRSSFSLTAKRTAEALVQPKPISFEV